MKEVWIMCADNDKNGKHYHACASWDHAPSQDEIDLVRITINPHIFIEGFDWKYSEHAVTVNGKKYMCYEHISITKIEI